MITPRDTAPTVAPTSKDTAEIQGALEAALAATKHAACLTLHAENLIGSQHRPESRAWIGCALSDLREARNKLNTTLRRIQHKSD